MTAAYHTGQFIDGAWQEGEGPSLSSFDPALGTLLWQGRMASAGQVDQAVRAGEKAFASWSLKPLEARASILQKYRDILVHERENLAQIIAQEAGKSLWDARGEAGAMAGKIDISLKAYEERTPSREAVTGSVRTRLSHRPYGVMAVFGPYNFPGHLPNGHIVPALLAGNTIVFKPSEQTPRVAAFMAIKLTEAGVPDGVFNLVQGAGEVGQALVAHDGIQGLLFTGSVPTGQKIAAALAARPHVIQALELGGNNALIMDGAADLEAASLMVILSAYISSGQRCTCARRLILVDRPQNQDFIEILTAMITRLRVGAWNETPEAFMGPLINAQAAAHVLGAENHLKTIGAKSLLPLMQLEKGDAFLRPGLIDVTGVSAPDREIFGPLLQLERVADLETAVKAANRTRYGLAAGLISDDKASYDYFYPRIRAGIVNWNQQLTGASSAAPFGGIGLSGNHRPSAYYAADYCAYPVASMDGAGDILQSPAWPIGLEKTGHSK